MTEPTAREAREAYIDLKERYRFLYGTGLQARLREQGEDITRWWEMGLRARGPAPIHPARPQLVQPPPEPEPPRLEDLPERVRDVIRVVAQERGVSPADIIGYRKTGRIADARQEAYRRLRVMPWAGKVPSLLQIGIWLHRDHSTVSHGVRR